MVSLIKSAVKAVHQSDDTTVEQSLYCSHVGLLHIYLRHSHVCLVLVKIGDDEGR